MKSLDGAMDNAVAALQEAIEDRRMQMHSVPASSGVSLQISNVLGQGGEFVQEFMNKAQKNIQEKPWDMVRQVAVYSFAIGLFLSLRHRKSSSGEKE